MPEVLGKPCVALRGALGAKQQAEEASGADGALGPG